MLFSGTEFSVWTSTRGATEGLKGEKGREERGETHHHQQSRHTCTFPSALAESGAETQDPAGTNFFLCKRNSDPWTVELWILHDIRPRCDQGPGYDGKIHCKNLVLSANFLLPAQVL